MKPAKPKPPKVKRRYPLHAVFLIYCLVSLLVAVGAFNTNNNLLFWLFGLSLGMLIVSGVVSGTMMMSLSVERLAVEQARVGAPLRVRYRVTNRSRWLPAVGLSVVERLGPAPVRPGQRAVLTCAPAGAVPHVPARSTVTIEALALPVVRGRLQLTGFEVETTFPFGIIRKSLWHPASVALIVHPAQAALPEGLFAAGGNTGAGAAATRPGRLGDEPVGIREYRQGDPARLVSWRASARRPGGDLVVRQNAEGSPRRFWVLLRLSRSSTPHQTETSLAVAASLIRAAVGAGLRVGLSLRSDWEREPGVSADVDVPPRAGGGAGVLLNDLSLLVVAGPGEALSRPGDEPRLGATDIVARVGPAGAWCVESAGGARGERRAAAGLGKGAR